MAEHLASIFGTEKDRVNCPFYFKIGACRHGDRCSRLHNKPTISQTLLLQNMYQNPVINAPLGPDGLPSKVDEQLAQEQFEDFYEDVFEELSQHGEIENCNVCDNLADHMVGNVYVKFRDEEACAKALAALQGRYYGGRPIIAEFSPVTDFREATCRQYEENTCNRGGYCNFMHLKPISKELRKILFGRYKGRSQSPEPSRDFDRGRDRGGHGGGGHDRYRDRDRGQHDRRDRYDRHDDRDRRRGRSRERSRERGNRDRGHHDRRERETSEERRAKIAAWNAASSGGDAGNTGGYGAPSAAYGNPPGPPPGGYPPGPPGPPPAGYGNGGGYGGGY